MFLAPAFLAGLLAIGLPLWLHRVAQANPTRHPFASLMLLEASETQKTSRRTLRYWLLLALRILVILALALAFAGPLVPQRAVPPVNPDARLHAIVLDTSLSMQYANRWPLALDEARAIVDAARAGDQLLLVEAAGRRVQVIAQAFSASERDDLRVTLNQIRPGNERLDYGLLMSTASGWLGTTHLPMQLHLISDMQRSAGPLRFADLEPPAGVETVFHDVGDADVANTYIEKLEQDRLGALAVTVRTSATNVQRREAILLIDGEEVARRPVQVGPAVVVPAPREGEGSPPPDLLTQSSGAEALAEAQLTLPLPELKPRAHRIEVALEPFDALPQDDRYFAILENTDPRVLVVSREAGSDDAIYAAAAIGAASTVQLKAEQRTAREIEGRNLADYAALVITDMGALGSGASTRIAEHVQGGGAALVLLGPGVSEQRSGLLAGLALNDVVTKPTRVATVDTTHPALRQSEGWQAVQFLRHLRVTPGEDDKVLISLQDGAPLLIERTLGAGRLLLLTAPLAREWNDLATHPLFVNFMAQATQWLSGAGAPLTSAQVGSAVTTGLTAAQGGQIFDPQGRRVLELNETASVDRLIPEQIGFYEVRSGESARWLAVNSDVRESNLMRMSEASLQRWRGLERPAVPTQAEAADVVATPMPVNLGYALLAVLLLFAAAEMLAANHHLIVRREVPR